MMQTLNLNAAEIAEGITALESLKRYTVRGRGGDIAENLHRLRKKMQHLQERRKTLDEVYIRTDIDGQQVPASKPEIDVNRYLGSYDAKRTYKPGTIILHEKVFFEVQKGAKGVQPPDDETYVAVGKQVNGFRVKDELEYGKAVLDLERERQKVHIRTFPKAELDEIEDLPGACYFFPMLEMEDLDEPAEEGDIAVSENGQLVDAE